MVGSPCQEFVDSELLVNVSESCVASLHRLSSIKCCCTAVNVSFLRPAKNRYLIIFIHHKNGR